MAIKSSDEPINAKTMQGFHIAGILIIIISLFLFPCLLVGCGSNAGSTNGSSISSSSSSSKVDFVGTWICIGFMADDLSIPIQEMDKENGTNTTYGIVFDKDGSFCCAYEDDVNEPFLSTGTWERSPNGVYIQPGDTEGIYKDDGLIYLEDRGLVAVFQKASDDTPNIKK